MFNLFGFVSKTNVTYVEFVRRDCTCESGAETQFKVGVNDAILPYLKQLWLVPFSTLSIKCIGTNPVDTVEVQQFFSQRSVNCTITVIDHLCKAMEVQERVQNVVKYTDHNLIIQEVLLEDKVPIMVISTNFAQANKYGLFGSGDSYYFSPLLRKKDDLYNLTDSNLDKFATDFYKALVQSSVDFADEIHNCLKSGVSTQHITRSVIREFLSTAQQNYELKDPTFYSPDRYKIKNGYKLKQVGDTQVIIPPQVYIEKENEVEFEERSKNFCNALEKVLELFEGKRIIIALQEIEPIRVFLRAVSSNEYISSKFKLVDKEYATFTKDDGESKTIVFSNFGEITKLEKDDFAKYLSPKIDKNTKYLITDSELSTPVTLYNVHIDYSVANSKTVSLYDTVASVFSQSNTIIVGDFNAKDLPSDDYQYDYLAIDTPEVNFYQAHTTKDIVTISRDVEFVENLLVNYLLSDIISDERYINPMLFETKVHRFNKIYVSDCPENHGNVLINAKRIIKA